MLSVPNSFTEFQPCNFKLDHYWGESREALIAALTQVLFRGIALNHLK
jgi:hypothetical protein